MTDQERFWDKVDWQGGHALWMGATHQKTGRGVFKAEGRTWDAARLSWAEANGPTPPGGVVKPGCGQRACVNPAHLLLFVNGVDVRAAALAAQCRSAADDDGFWASDAVRKPAFWAPIGGR